MAGAAGYEKFPAKRPDREVVADVLAPVGDSAGDEEGGAGSEQPGSSRLHPRRQRREGHGHGQPQVDRTLDDGRQVRSDQVSRSYGRLVAGLGQGKAEQESHGEAHRAVNDEDPLCSRHPSPNDALADVLNANCEMFDQIGDALARCLEVARTNDLIRQLLDISYFGRRVDSMSRLARRLQDAGRLAPGWTQSRVADVLIILTSLEAYETLTRHRARATKQASDTLFAMAQTFLIAPDK